MGDPWFRKGRPEKKSPATRRTHRRYRNGLRIGKFYQPGEACGGIPMEKDPSGNYGCPENAKRCGHKKGMYRVASQLPQIRPGHGRVTGEDKREMV